MTIHNIWNFADIVPFAKVKLRTAHMHIPPVANIYSIKPPHIESERERAIVEIPCMDFLGAC